MTRKTAIVLQDEPRFPFETMTGDCVVSVGGFVDGWSTDCGGRVEGAVVTSSTGTVVIGRALAGTVDSGRIEIDVKFVGKVVGGTVDVALVGERVGRTVDTGLGANVVALVGEEVGLDVGD